MADANPFRLFPRQVRTVSLITLPKAVTAKGREETVLTSQLRVIVKNKYNSTVNGLVETVPGLLSIHIDVNSLPEPYKSDCVRLVDTCIKISGCNYRCRDVSQGDDMDRGVTQFITVQAVPWARVTL